MSHLLVDAALQGTQLKGCYRVEDQIGKGGMAFVYRGLDVRSQQRVAIKVLFSHLAIEANVRDRFLRESQIQSQLKHPYVVQVYDLIDERGIIGIVQEWMDCGDLEQWSQQQGLPLSYEALWAVMSPVIEAVGFAHSQGIIHRDLKTQNILLKEGPGWPIAKLADFGIAKNINASGPTKTGRSLGTPLYMAPEQIKDAKYVDHRADLYSLGVLLYVLSSGHFPFQGEAHQVLFQIFSTQPPDPPGVDPVLGALIMQCLEKNPERRIPSCEALHSALSVILNAPKMLEQPRPEEPVVPPTWADQALPSELLMRPRRSEASPAFGQSQQEQLPTAASDIYEAVALVPTPALGGSAWAHPTKDQPESTAPSPSPSFSAPPSPGEAAPAAMRSSRLILIVLALLAGLGLGLFGVRAALQTPPKPSPQPSPPRSAPSKARGPAKSAPSRPAPSRRKKASAPAVRPPSLKQQALGLRWLLGMLHAHGGQKALSKIHKIYASGTLIRRVRGHSTHYTYSTYSLSPHFLRRDLAGHAGRFVEIFNGARGWTFGHGKPRLWSPAQLQRARREHRSLHIERHYASLKPEQIYFSHTSFIGTKRTAVVTFALKHGHKVHLSIHHRSHMLLARKYTFDHRGKKAYKWKFYSHYKALRIPHTRLHAKLPFAIETYTRAILTAKERFHRIELNSHRIHKRIFLPH